MNCPQCGKNPLRNSGSEEIILDQMGHDWHRKCWEAFCAEYNDVLDSKDIQLKEADSITPTYGERITTEQSEVIKLLEDCPFCGGPCVNDMEDY